MEFKPAILATLLVCTTAFVVQGQQTQCTHGDVRLADGDHDLEGRVEVCISGVWGTVCGDGWDSVDAGVVCRQLGYEYEGARAFRYSFYFGFGFGPVHMTSVGCTGTETSLVNCRYSTDPFELYFFCGHFFDAGVRCQRGVEIDSVVQYNITEADTDIEAIRLINGIENVNMGRLELLYNGTWGTVCDRFWSYSDAKVACRMIGYEDAACAVTTNHFGRANTSVPFWMDNVQCTGSEETLDNCSFPGWGVHNCSHSTNDAGIVCANTSEIGIPYDIQLLDSTTSILNISWMVPELSSERDSFRYYISYQSEDQDTPRARIFIPRRGGDSPTRISYVLSSLTQDTEYTIRIRGQLRYSPCTTYSSGSYSDSVSFRTNATRKQSAIPIRLVSPYPELDFLGRIEVMYNNQWGTICNDAFSTTDGNVVCQMLNFTQGALCIPYTGNSFAPGTGPIWLDNVACSSHDEVLDDCGHNGWGVHNCRHSDDVGVICRTTLPPVMNLAVTSVSTSYAILRWSQYSFPRGTSSSQYYILYKSRGISRTAIVSRSRTTYTLRNLIFERTYEVSIRARIRYSYCPYYSIYGEYSNKLNITTMESAPDGPPTSFDLVVVNSTAIEALWELPEIGVRNGMIRGYKLYVQSGGRDIRTVTIPNNQTLAYTVGGLQRATSYTFSILAYTVADGPRSIFLTATTPFSDPLIIGFGINGDGIDKVTKYGYSSGIQVHCTVSKDPSIIATDWFFSNGSKVGLVDANFREGHYNNGTTVLQIGTGRRLTYCDGGNYTCVVNTTSGRIQKRSFHLLIGRLPPSPSRPSASEIKSTSIKLDWSQSVCDGGHIPRVFNIRYRRLNSDSNAYSYISVLATSQKRYTFTGLIPSTVYEFSVQTISFDLRTSYYSSMASFTTLPPAPSAPRDVKVRLVAPFLAEVRWRVPALSNGVITHYTVYAIPQISHEETRNKRQTPTLPKTIKKVFPSTTTAGNISLTEHSITYQFQVSASVTVGQISNEGDLSPVSPNTTAFIPRPALPVPTNLRMINFTNTSISLSWEYPPPPAEAFEKFLVTYYSKVEWRSPGNDLVQFEDSGEMSVTDTTVTISPLVPGTNYLVGVSAVTQSGRGAELTRYATTKTSLDERLAFFQVRMSPISNCLDFVDPSNNVTDRLLKFRRATIEELNARVCSSCGLTMANIRGDEFSCHGGLKNRIVYRAMIIGTDTYSAPSLVSLIQSWVSSGSASISVFSSRLRFDKNCVTLLDTFSEPDCPLKVEPQQTTMVPTQKDNVAPSASPQQLRAGEIGGILIGIIIIVLLAVLITIIVVIALRKYKFKTLKSTVQHDRMFDASFSDIGSTKENINLYVDSKES